MPSPWIETGAAIQDQAKRIIVDTSRTIHKISMLVQGGFRFLGLRLIDEQNYAFVNRVWCTADSSDSAWVTKEIDQGQEIIGLQAYTDHENFC